MKKGNTGNKINAVLESAVASIIPSPTLPTPVVSSDILGSPISQYLSERKLFFVCAISFCITRSSV